MGVPVTESGENVLQQLARELALPTAERVRAGSPLAVAVREHAREREALGFAPKDIVTEFLLLRRVLWRLVQERAATLDAGDVLTLETRLNMAIDQLTVECLVAYFDRA